MKQSRRLPSGWTPEKGTARTEKACAAREHEPVTIERLERALALCARLVVLDGPIVIPFFERLERDLAEMRRDQDAVARAKRLLDKRDAGVHSTAPQP
jgi:hypothetical protein